MRRTPNQLQAEIDAVQARAAQAQPAATATRESSFVYRPGGVTAGNVYAAWAPLYAALSATAGTRTVRIDDSLISPAVIPAGHYDLDGVQLTSIASFSTNGGAVLRFADGATVSLGELGIAPWLTVESSSDTVPVVTVASGVECNLDLNFSTLRAAGAAPFVTVQSGGFLWIDGNSCEIGDGGNRVLDVAAGGSGALFIQGLSILHPTIFSGAGAAGVFVGLDDSTLFCVLGAGATATLDSRAEQVAYTAASAPNWSNAPPATVAAALDRIAAKIGPIP
jgi:hypothetical protein